MHDIDANKPGGSIKIRVSTYAYTLELRRQMLSDLAAKRGELERSLAAKRAELLSTYRGQLLATMGNDAAGATPEALDDIYAEFLEAAPGGHLAEAAKKAAKVAAHAH